VTFRIRAQLAAPGDPTNDATSPGRRSQGGGRRPHHQRAVANSDEVQRQLLFLPGNLTDGIEPSDDPLIDARDGGLSLLLRAAHRDSLRAGRRFSPPPPRLQSVPRAYHRAVAPEEHVEPAAGSRRGRCRDGIWSVDGQAMVLVPRHFWAFVQMECERRFGAEAARGAITTRPPPRGAALVRAQAPLTISPASRCFATTSPA